MKRRILEGGVGILLLAFLCHVNTYAQPVNLCANTLTLTPSTNVGFFQLGPSCVASDMYIHLTVAVPCTSQCEIPSSSFEIYDDQDQLIAQQSFSCTAGGDWYICVPDGTSGYIIVYWGCEDGPGPQNPPELQVDAQTGC